ncbi:MAG TPA: bifunctional GTP diphosphokinase/guanosine-3',5'-bis pyrophosphate 3'-pyrophosphohydrolase [Gammaproteobacteria bacterium]|nr:bifunctional GTP diphosphokinase/guanosine-3',5'-bis pyrophosphate 3'-pyrophosphohydrolase [Gammaproteobacteria bacterium]
MAHATSILTRAGRERRSAGIDNLLARLETYLGPEQVDTIRRAYDFGAHAHEGQRRMSGEPYISHPVAVAGILADMHMDAATICAAVLHDVIEDTPTAKDEIAAEFGEEVAQLVDGVSKLTHIQFQSRVEAQAENFRKMLLAMVEDIRVILMKLADRLHNMRTLGVMPAHKRRRIARETLEIYAPIANRLGMNAMRLELEDLGFRALYPKRYRVLARQLRRDRGHHKEIVRKITQALKQALRQESVEAQVAGREKHLYSVYMKMRTKRLALRDIMDMYGFRIVVDKVDTCYRALGVVHACYKPAPGRFKDYIAIPKGNGYQSLHTVLVGPQGAPVEVQIRTEAMHKIAESGVAAHWLYKSHEAAATAPEARAREWLRGMLEMQKGAGSSAEFLENVKVDLFPDEVYVFTPQGEIRRLPRGATAVDFAYAVHTDVGNACVAAKVDRRMIPLRTPLVNGQTVEIITAKGAIPNPAWLNFVVTGKARANIRHYLKSIKRDKAVGLGRRLLERALESYHSKLKKLPPERIEAVLKEFKLASLDDLMEQIGLGERLAPLVARRLLPEEAREAEPEASGPLSIKGTEGMVVSLGRCCHPIPGDPIMGYLSAGRGIVIHRDSCRNLADYRSQPDKWIEVQWEKDIGREFAVEIRCEVENERGVLATVAATIAELGSNIEHVALQERDGRTSTINLVFFVQDRKHLARIMRHIRQMPQVLRVARTRF